MAVPGQFVSVGGGRAPAYRCPEKMPRENRDVGIAKNVRAIEWLKAEILSRLGQLSRSLLDAEEDAVVESMAAIVSCVYLLARRVGITFSRLDARVDQRLRDSIRSGHQLESWYGDLSALTQYRKEKGRDGL